MKQVRRYDIGGLSKPVKEANGWLRVDAYLTRTGVFSYRQPDGATRLEYRPPDEVFKADSLKSFEAVPFTNDHPPGVLDANNTKRFQVGHLVGAPVQDGERMRATILVTDAQTIEDMQGGKQQISNGYLCELDEVPGIAPDGQRYDAIQRNIVGNHVALVNEGRAGSEIRARLDAADAVMIASEVSRPIHDESASIRQDGTKMKIKLDGVEVEVDQTVAQLIEKSQATAQAKLDAAAGDAKKVQAERDAHAARADKAEKDLKQAKADLEAAPAKLRADMAERARLEKVAASVCGSEVKADELSDADLRKAIAATQTDEKLDEKSEAYVAALVDIAAKRADESSEISRMLDRSSPITGLGEASPDKAKALFEAAQKKFTGAKAKA